MNKAVTLRSALAGACALATLAHCGGSSTHATTTPTNQTSQSDTHATAHAGDGAIDVSPVPQPTTVVAVVRIASLDGLIERLTQISGLGDTIRSQADSALEAASSGLASAIDRHGTVDVVFAANNHNDTDAVVSFAGPTVDDLERRFANTHRLTAMSNGMRRIERNPSPNSDQNSAERSGDPAEHQVCIAAPTPDTHATRIVCGENGTVVDAMAPFLARTLVRQQVPADAVTLSVLMNPVREYLMHDQIAGLDRDRQQFDAQLSQNTTFVDPAIRQAVSTLVHEFFDAVHGLMVDPQTASASLTFGAERVALHVGFDMRGPDGAILRAIADGTRGQPAVPSSLLTHLLPSGWMYSTATFDTRPFRPTLAQAVELGNQLAQHDSSLDTADRTALRAALDAITITDQTAFAIAVGNDDAGHYWATARSHGTTVTGAQEITAVRAIFSALRRPHIIRLIRAAFEQAHIPMIDLGDLRELPARGLPPGSFGVRLPPVSTLLAQSTASSAPVIAPSSPHHPGRRPAPTGGHAASTESPIELLCVPDGNDFAVYLGNDARAVYTRSQANTTSGIDQAAVIVPNATLVSAFVLAGLPNLFRATSPSNSGQMASALSHLSDQGTTPIALRMSSTQGDGLSQFALDTDIATARIREYFALFAGGGGGGGNGGQTHRGQTP